MEENCNDELQQTIESNKSSSIAETLFVLQLLNYIKFLILVAISDFKETIKFGEQLLPFLENNGADSMIVLSVTESLGLAHLQIGSYQQATNHFNKQLELAKEAGDRAMEASAYLNLGCVYHSLSNFMKSIGYHSKCLEIAKELGDRSGEGGAYANLGNVYDSLGDFKKAIDYHSKCLEIAKEFGDRAGEGGAYANLGNAYYSLGDFKKAIGHHSAHLEIAKEVEDQAGEAKAYGNLGCDYHSLGDFKRAIDFHFKDLEIVKEIGDLAGEGMAYGNLGNAYQSLGDFKKAIQYISKDLEIAKEVGNRGGEGSTYGNLGIAYRSLGDLKKAIEYHSKQLEIAKEVGDRAGEGKAYANLGNDHFSLGDFKKAIEYHSKDLEIAKEVEDQAGEGRAYGNLGSAYRSLGDFKKAIDFHFKDLKIAKEVGDRAGEGMACGNLGNDHFSLGEFKKAIEYYSKGLEIDMEVGDIAGKGMAYGNLGNAYRSLGDLKKAIENHSKCLEIAIEAGDRAMEGKAFGNLGNAYYSLGDFKKAIDYHSKRLKIAKEVEDQMGVAIAYNNLGIAYFDLHDLHAAEECLEQAIETMTMLRSLLERSHSLKISFLETQQTTYRLLQKTLVPMKKYDRALEVSEEGRTRAFVDQLSSQLSETPFANVPSIKLLQIQQLSHTCTIVEYTIHSESSYVDEKWNDANVLYIWVVDNGEVYFRKVHLDEIPCLNSSRLEDLVQKTSRQIEIARGETSNLFIDVADDWNDPLMELLMNLYEILIKEIEMYLPKDPLREIIIVPDKCLFLVPFAALYHEGQYLIEEHTISIAPSIQIAVMTRGHSDNEKLKEALLNANEDKVIVVGNATTSKVAGKPELNPIPGAEIESNEIAGVLNIIPLLGNKATKEVVTSKLTMTGKTEGITVAHFATHGVLDYYDEMQGGLVLHDGILTSPEVMKWNLRSLELVVMSACDTGRGEIKADGVVGLARAFLCAGVTSVLVSLCPVSDNYTRLLMVEFYHQLIDGARLDQPLSLANKLRDAMIWMINESEAGPQHWSAFVLM